MAIADDLQVANLERLHNAMTAALPLAGSRQLADGQTAAELALESAYVMAVQPPLRDTYAFALRGISAVEDEDEDEILAWILRRFRADPPDELAAVIYRYGRRGFDLGGTMALAMLGVMRPFRLANEDLVAALQLYALDLVDPDADISLTHTTASETASRFVRLREEGQDTGSIIGAFGVYATARSLYRSGRIAETETVRVTRQGLVETFRRNDVTEYLYLTQFDDRVCRICSPYHGRRFSEEEWALLYMLIPQHGSCRCYWTPVLEGWTVPEEFWAGE